MTFEVFINKTTKQHSSLNILLLLFKPISVVVSWSNIEFVQLVIFYFHCLFYNINSGMYYDEDGDLAEEFYEEVTPAQGTPWMRRITKNLTRQVCLFLLIPR